MPTNLSDTSAFTSPVVAAADGDSANAASLTQGLQPLANRTRYLLDALLNSALVGNGVDSDGTQINVRPFSAVINGKRYDSPLTVVPLSGLTPSTWYYLYYDTSAGCLLSLNGPDAALQYESVGGVSTVTRRYLCSVYATGASAVRPFRYGFASRRMVWRSQGTTLSPTITGAFSNTSLAAWAPPHARVVRFALHVVDSNTNALGAAVSTLVNFKTPGDATSDFDYFPVGRTSSAEIEMVCDTSQNVAFQSQSTATGGTLSFLLSPRGFAE